MDHSGSRKQEHRRPVADSIRRGDAHRRKDMGRREWVEGDRRKVRRGIRQGVGRGSAPGVGVPRIRHEGGVCQRLQEGHQVGPLSRGDREAPHARILERIIAPVPGMRPDLYEASAAGVVVDHRLEGSYAAIVPVGKRQRHVAERRNLHAAHVGGTARGFHQPPI
ncbi:MAG: hypothetical protein ACK55I_27205, partial [bacterium]